MTSLRTLIEPTTFHSFGYERNACRAQRVLRQTPAQAGSPTDRADEAARAGGV